MITGKKIWESTRKGTWLLLVEYSDRACGEMTKHNSKKEAQEYFMSHYLRH